MKYLLVMLIVIITNLTFSQTLIVEDSVVNTNCYDSPTGKVLLTKVEGGSGYGTYTYEWKDSTGTVIDTVQNLIGVKSGTYTVKVTDEINNVVNLTSIINQPNKIEIISTVIPGDDEASIYNEIISDTPIIKYEYFELKGKKNKNQYPVSIDELNELDAGYYRTKVTDSKGCTMENVGWVEIKDVDVADKLYLKIYPNPANIYVIAEYKINERTEYTFKITRYDHSLEVVYSQILDPSLNKLELMVNQFEPGTYFVTISDYRKARIGEKLKIIHP